MIQYPNDGKVYAWSFWSCRTLLLDMEDDKQLSSWPSCGLLNSSVTASSDRHYLRHELGLAAGHTLFEFKYSAYDAVR